MGEGRFAHYSNYFEPRRVPGVLHIDIYSGHYLQSLTVVQSLLA